MTTNDRQRHRAEIDRIFLSGTPSWEYDNYLQLLPPVPGELQVQTNATFTDKWRRYGESNEKELLYAAQRAWYLQLYGFETEQALAKYLQSCRMVLDAGCGLGYKAAWFADLAPDTTVIGVDYSAAAIQAATAYRDRSNLFFFQGDIAALPMLEGAFDYVSCDQVIMHTQDPDRTFAELARLTSAAGQFACYFYAKKALPRELLDDYFRKHCQSMSSEDLWTMAEQVTELGKRLDALREEIEVPAIPALGIPAGRTTVQRFIYWNFMKCFWNESLGRDTSIVTNFDWYSPSQARRYERSEIERLVSVAGMQILTFHQEEACYSGRFGWPSKAK